MTEETKRALAMLQAFEQVGVQRFDVTLTDIEGRKLSFLTNRSLSELRQAVGPLVHKATQERQNVILRPRPPANGVEVIQLDDLSLGKAKGLQDRAFMVLCTSPQNYQAWIAVANSEPDFARRLRKGTGADLSASGATRISGSRNFKTKYAPTFPVIEIVHHNPGLIVPSAELTQAGLVAAKETPIRVSPPLRWRPSGSGRAWPSYEKCVSGAPPVHGGDPRPDISRADFTWCMIAIDWGKSVEATAARLMQHSQKAQENGEAYATLTAQNAAAAVARRRGGLPSR